MNLDFLKVSVKLINHSKIKYWIMFLMLLIGNRWQS